MTTTLSTGQHVWHTLEPQHLGVLASQADIGRSVLMVAKVRHELVIGVTIGIVEWVELLGLPSEELREQLVTRGPRSDPEHLYLRDVTFHDNIDDFQLARRVHRVRIRDVEASRVRLVAA